MNRQYGTAVYTDRPAPVRECAYCFNRIVRRKRGGGFTWVTVAHDDPCCHFGSFGSHVPTELLREASRG